MRKKAIQLSEVKRRGTASNIAEVYLEGRGASKLKPFTAGNLPPMRVFLSGGRGWTARDLDDWAARKTDTPGGPTPPNEGEGVSKKCPVEGA